MYFDVAQLILCNTIWKCPQVAACIAPLHGNTDALFGAHASGHTSSLRPLATRALIKFWKPVFLVFVHLSGSIMVSFLRANKCQATGCGGQLQVCLERIQGACVGPWQSEASFWHGLWLVLTRTDYCWWTWYCLYYGAERRYVPPFIIRTAT